MVRKNAQILRFEYGVILNGSQTLVGSVLSSFRFEYGVILNGSQTTVKEDVKNEGFEYGVILNGSQTWGEKMKSSV